MIFISSFTQTKDVEISHYLFPEFTQGAILMNDGMKYEALLNYNSLTEEMIFEDKGIKMAIAKTDLWLVDTVFIKDRKFIALNSKFVEILSQSKWDLYAEHKCKLKDLGKPIGYGSTSKTTAIESYSSFYSGGDLYNLKLPDIYEIEPNTYYWLKKNGEENRFTSMSELRKFYKDKKDLFKAYVKKHDIKYDNQESITQLIEYLESN